MTTSNVAANSILSTLQTGVFSQPSITSKSQSTSFANTLSAKTAGGLNVRSFNLYSDPDFVYAPQEPGGGCMSISFDNMLFSVYKSENYSADNPVMLVKGINADGKKFEMEINVNDIDPRNTSLVELAAIDGHNAVNGKGNPATPSVKMAVTTQYLTGNNAYFDERADAFTQMDFIPAMLEMMETQRYHGNWEGYMRYKEIIDSLLNVGMK